MAKLVGGPLRAMVWVKAPEKEIVSVRLVFRLVEDPTGPFWSFGFGFAAGGDPVLREVQGVPVFEVK